MDNKMLGELLTRSLGKYHFKSYGGKLFYLELKDSILILEQIIYNGGAELYLSIIIKECHPELGKITKSTLKDEMLIDTYTSNKLFYKTPKGYKWDFYDIDIKNFEDTIEDFYNENIKPFESSYLKGIEHYNELYTKIFYGAHIELYKDAAQKVGHMELAAYRGHDWLLSDSYYLIFICKIDSRFINSNTEKYIIDNVIKNIPEGIKGKELTKWCNERCKEIFISKRKRRDFGWGLTLPFVDGKPLKFYGCESKDGKLIQVYIDEDSGDLYHCLVLDKSDLNNIKYELRKV